MVRVIKKLKTLKLWAKNNKGPLLILIFFFFSIYEVRRNLTYRFPQSFIDSVRGKYHLRKIFIPGTFVDSLNAEGKEGFEIIKKYALESFSLSRKLRKEIESKHRIYESVYPIRVDVDSKHILMFVEEELTKSCELIERKRKIKYVYCP